MPDAANGGAHSWQEALAEAEQAAGRHLQVIDGYWARAFICVMRGQAIPPPPALQPSTERGEVPEKPRSAWDVLGLLPGASPLAIRRAFQQKALQTHPDQGGDAAEFRAVVRAFERLTTRRRKPPRVTRSTR